MHRISSIFYRAAVLVSVLALAFSCISNKDYLDVQQNRYATVLMKFDVSADDVQVKSANELTQTEKVINTLRIYAFTDGKNVGHYYQGTSVNTDILMDITMINVNTTTGKQNIKFYVIANETSMVLEETMPQLNEMTTEKELNDYRFIAMNESNGMPMFCCDTVMLNMRAFRSVNTILDDTSLEGHEGHQILARTLDFKLKRPVGKISFMAAKKSSSTPDVVFNSVTLLASGTRQYNYLMPQDEDFLKTLSPGLNNRPFFNSTSLYTVTATEDDGYEDIASLYCAELPFGSQEWNIPNNENSAVLKVEYSMGHGADIRNVYIYLPPILRNQWVKVMCTISGEGQVMVRYTVNDWNLVIGSDEDGDGEEDYIVFDYPTHTYILPSLPTQDNPYPDPDPNGGPEVKPYMSVQNPFCGYFQILYPEGQKWSPTIVRVENGNAQVSDYTINVYKVDKFGNEVDVTTNNETYGLNDEQSSYFKIQVVPSEAKNVGAKVYLGITADIQGFGHAEYLLINGSQAESFWPDEGGNDPSVLIITQVEEVQ